MSMLVADVASQVHVGHLPNPVSVQPDWPVHYDYNRYADLTVDQIIATIRGTALGLLKRGTKAVLIARRELGGLLHAISKKITSYTAQVALFRRIADLEYSEARRHIKLWMSWGRIEKMLRDREESCRRRGVPFVTPGLRRCLKMAGIMRTPAPPHDPSPPPLGSKPLPDDMAALTAMVEELQQKNRLERAEKTRLLVDLDIARDELRELAFNHGDEQTKGIMGKSTGWFKRRRGPVPPPRPERPAEIEIRLGDCLDRIEDEANSYDSVVTDAPYSIALHGK
jgi:hypothetical protein